MAARITDDEWDDLTHENFDTTALLRAVDAVDVLRGDLNDSADGAPPQLRTDLLKLHQLAMAAFNEGSRSRVAELFDLAVDLQDQVDHLMTSLEQVQETLSRLTALSESERTAILTRHAPLVTRHFHGPLPPPPERRRRAV